MLALNWSNAMKLSIPFNHIDEFKIEYSSWGVESRAQTMTLMHNPNPTPEGLLICEVCDSFIEAHSKWADFKTH